MEKLKNLSSSRAHKGHSRQLKKGNKPRRDDPAAPAAGCAHRKARSASSQASRARRKIGRGICHPEYGGASLTILIGLRLLADKECHSQREIDAAMTALVAKLETRELLLARLDPLTGRLLLTC